MSLAHRIVVKVVCRGDFDHTCSKIWININVCDNRNLAIAQRQNHRFSDHMLVSGIVGVNHDGAVTEHGFGPCCCHRELSTAICKRVVNFPDAALLLFAHNFEVGDCGHQDRVPVDQTLAPINQALLIQADKGFPHHGRALLIHGEVFEIPIGRGSKAAHLPGDA